MVCIGALDKALKFGERLQVMAVNVEFGVNQSTE